MWRVVEISVEPEHAELVASLLFDLGTAGVVTLDEATGQTTLAAYFDSHSQVDELEQAIAEELSRASLTARVVSTTEVPEQDWMQTWKDGFEPVRVGERLLISPSWKAVDPAGCVAVVRIDPGMAFGTGTHETTRMCLEAVERLFKSGRVLDVGTGTGIVAIAAAKLSPESQAVAIDIDPVAVSVAAENVEINEVAPRVAVVEGQPRGFRGQNFDFVVANLTAETIIDIARDLVECVAPGGLLVVSGVLNEYSSDVEESLVSAGVNVVETNERGEWSALIAKRLD